VRGDARKGVPYRDTQLLTAATKLVTPFSAIPPCGRPRAPGGTLAAVPLPDRLRRPTTR